MNSQNGRILNNDFTTEGILGSLAWQIMMNNKISQEPHFIIPKGFRVWCHPCNTGFKSIKEYQIHKETPQHERAKERYFNVI